MDDNYKKKLLHIASVLRDPKICFLVPLKEYGIGQALKMMSTKSRICPGLNVYIYIMGSYNNFASQQQRTD